MQQPQNIWAITEYLRSLENNQLRNGWEEYKKNWNGEQAQLKEIKLLMTDGIKRMIFLDKRWL